LLNKYVIVTGASRGVGEETCKLLSLKYNVIAISRNIERMNFIFSEYKNIYPYQMDVTDFSLHDELYNYIKDKEIVALVNNAGGGSESHLVENDSPESWQYAYNLNVVSPMSLSKMVIPIMKKNGYGDIIIITSICGYYPYKKGGNYATAKRGAISLAETLRMEMSGSGIKVSQIAPGSIDTNKEVKNNIAIQAEDVAEAIRWIIELPPTVNVDSMTIMHPENQRHG
jgi:NADP-dependent 3-hydroxy acid dehydrogenase YdfG